MQWLGLLRMKISSKAVNPSRGNIPQKPSHQAGSIIQELTGEASQIELSRIYWAKILMERKLFAFFQIEISNQ